MNRYMAYQSIEPIDGQVRKLIQCLFGKYKFVLAITYFPLGKIVGFFDIVFVDFINIYRMVPKLAILSLPNLSLAVSSRIFWRFFKSTYYLAFREYLLPPILVTRSGSNSWMTGFRNDCCERWGTVMVVLYQQQ